MKQLLIALSVLLALTACGKKGNKGSDDNESLSCEDLPFVGSWKQIGGDDILTINNNCTGHSLSGFSYCDLSLNFTIPKNGVTTVTTHTSDGGSNCLPLGTYECFGQRYSAGEGDERLNLACATMGKTLSFIRVVD